VRACISENKYLLLVTLHVILTHNHGRRFFRNSGLDLATKNSCGLGASDLSLCHALPIPSSSSAHKVNASIPEARPCTANGLNQLLLLRDGVA
jgi:hypothetical protein